MNLRGMANSTIQAVNQNQSVIWLQSNGYTTNADGSRTSNEISTTLQGQIQGLSSGDMRHADGLNIQGVMRSVYLYGNIEGVVRADQQGGDILQFPEVANGPIRNWRVFQVMETWPDWCRVLVVLQS